MFQRSVGLAVQFRIVRLVPFEDVVNGSKQYSGDGNNHFFGPLRFLIERYRLRISGLCF